MRGRKLGQTELTIFDMDLIVKLTKEGKFRSEIANAVGCAKSTVARYQKHYGLL